MSKIFILEDDKKRIDRFKQDLIGHTLTIRSSYFSAFKYLFDGENVATGYRDTDVLFLDYDLVDTDKKYIERTYEERHSGGDLAFDIYNYALRAPADTHHPLIIIHSLNHQAAGLMQRMLLHAEELEHKVIVFPGAWEALDKFSKDFDPDTVRRYTDALSTYKY